METISLKTVYQTLHELAAMGEIAALDLGTGMTRFDPNVDGVHHHLVCRGCGKVRDLHADFSAVTVPDRRRRGIRRRRGRGRVPRALSRLPAPVRPAAPWRPDGGLAHRPPAT